MTARAKRAYDHLASTYDRRWAHYTEATLRTTLDGLERYRWERVLDLAAGTGELIERIVDRYPGPRIVGVDLSRGMLSRATQKSSSHSWEPVQGDAARLPFADGSFDAVLCANAFHIFPRPEMVLGEIRRVLGVGGTLILTDWCDDYLSCKLYSLYLRFTDPAFHHIYTIDGLREMLERSGVYHHLGPQVQDRLALGADAVRGASNPVRNRGGDQVTDSRFLTRAAVRAQRRNADQRCPTGSNASGSKLGLWWLRPCGVWCVDRRREANRIEASTVPPRTPAPPMMPATTQAGSMAGG